VAERAEDELLDLVGDARLVLLGEATHGTHEFYAERAAITRRLIAERGFAAVAVEADWPDAHRVNRIVRGVGEDADADSALGEFRRFPRWMWRNTVVRDFAGWLREHNAARRAERRAGFYGLDLYSLHASIEAVLQFLERTDPDAARRARERYSCFDHAGAGDGQAYGAAVSYGRSESCEDDVVEQLLDVRRTAAEIAAGDGRLAEDDAFFAEQNARLVRNAERYYRAMFRGREESWNLRDHHMADTLDALCTHLHADGRPAGIVVWAHNSHLGDARATEMSRRGELNLGQLVRERHGDAAFSLGFTTAAGTVTAASDWDGPGERKRVRPPLPGSVEALLHDTGRARVVVDLAGDGALTRQLREPLLERAIGVIYRPETERWSHYFEARVGDQFDALVHIDETRALEPLEPDAGWVPAGEAPETYPTAL
jgi:erythromycin esterase-like protein